MEEFNWHVKLADDIYTLQKQVSNLIEQSHERKCIKKRVRYHFIHPGDSHSYGRYLFLGRKENTTFSTYPCAFKSSMDSVAAHLTYDHPTIAMMDIYYTDRIQNVEFLELSDEDHYTEDDIQILRGTVEKTLDIMDRCIQAYEKYKYASGGPLATMCKERDRVKRLLD